MVNFAKMMDNVKASEIRELLALTQRPEVTSFAGGLPAPELFPVQDFKKACDAVLDEQGTVALQYGTTDGWAPLRRQIAERMLAKNSIHTDPANASRVWTTPPVCSSIRATWSSLRARPTSAH